MTDNHSTDNAESEPSSVAANISVSELAARRLGGSSQEAPEEVSTEEVIAEEPSVESEEEVEEVVEDVDESSAEETEESESSEDVLSQIDLDEMSEADLRELGKKLGSKAVERFGKLTAQRKAAEEELAKLRASLAEADNDPLKGTQEAFKMFWRFASSLSFTDLLAATVTSSAIVISLVLVSASRLSKNCLEVINKYASNWWLVWVVLSWTSKNFLV